VITWRARGPPLLRGEAIDNAPIDIAPRKEVINAMSTPHEPPSAETWQRFLATHAKGDVVTGRVVDVVPFGAFVDVGDGIHGLVHISEWVTPLERDTTVPVRIREIDPALRRMSLVPA
jgi:ribosomal protein S1